jgi:hypothetical protein
MKLSYCKKHTSINLILGFIWLANAVIQTFIGEAKWYDYVWFVFAAVYFAIFFYQKKAKYLSLENRTLKENWPFGE